MSPVHNHPGSFIVFSNFSWTVDWIELVNKSSWAYFLLLFIGWLFFNADESSSITNIRDVRFLAANCLPLSLSLSPPVLWSMVISLDNLKGKTPLSLMISLTASLVWSWVVRSHLTHLQHHLLECLFLLHPTGTIYVNRRVSWRMKLTRN